MARNKVLIIAGPNGAGKSTFARRGDDFAFETTLSGRTYVNLIRDWRALDYEVKLVFLALKNAEEAIARVAARVAQGGHFVPDAVVSRRFDSGIKNLHTVYKFEVDFWRLYDNSGEKPVLIDEGANNG